jgi:undecaprenyl-diphosphatase
LSNYLRDGFKKCMRRLYDLFEALILGTIQGLTEFLPVSSSGHLVIFQDFLGVMQQGITFEIMVHFGTVLSVMWVFGPDILRILSRFTREKQERHFALMLVLGVVPTGIIGLSLKMHLPCSTRTLSWLGLCCL